MDEVIKAGRERRHVLREVSQRDDSQFYCVALGCKLLVCLWVNFFQFPFSICMPVCLVKIVCFWPPYLIYSAF